MPEKHLHDWIGFSGVDANENHRARLWARRLELPMLFIALWILVTWYWESTQQEFSGNAERLNWAIWLFLIFETLLLSLLVDDKANYLKNNWLNVLMILFGIPVLWSDTPYVALLRSLRLLIFVSLLIQLSSSALQILARNRLGATLLVSTFFIIIAGYLIAGIDPSIASPGDGIWWAWVTTTTVGYGDIVPTSTAGRILAAALMLLGVGLVSLITANFSAFFVAHNKGNSELQRLQQLENQLQRIEEKLDTINKKLSD